jgi:DNA-directed RNA polymerase subunit RPC12/RpoP
LTDHFIQIGCSNCGRVLDVYDDMDRFACGYCGTEMMVQRRGGTVVLALAEALRKVHDGADKTAAELAVARLTEERQKLMKQSEALPDERFRRAKWGFGIGGALLLIGIIASKTVKNLKPSPIRRTELPPGLALRVETLRSVLAEVCPMTREQWLDNLRRDLNPDKEVLWWERVAGCFTAFVSKRTFSSNQRQAVFKIICGLSSGLCEQDLAADLAKLSESDLIELAMSVRSVAH